MSGQGLDRIAPAPGAGEMRSAASASACRSSAERSGRGVHSRHHQGGCCAHCRSGRDPSTRKRFHRAFLFHLRRDRWVARLVVVGHPDHSVGPGSSGREELTRRMTPVSFPQAFPRAARSALRQRFRAVRHGLETVVRRLASTAAASWPRRHRDRPLEPEERPSSRYGVGAGTQTAVARTASSRPRSRT